MGFMDLSIGGSDNTSDFSSDVIGEIMEKMKKEVDEESNEWNTPGYINVALVLKSLISNENEFHFLYGNKEFWETLNKYFDKTTFSNGDVEKQYQSLARWVKKMYKISKTY